MSVGAKITKERIENVIEMKGIQIEEGELKNRIVAL